MPVTAGLEGKLSVSKGCIVVLTTHNGGRVSGFVRGANSKTVTISQAMHGGYGNAPYVPFFSEVLSPFYLVWEWFDRDTYGLKEFAGYEVVVRAPPKSA